MIAWLRRFFKMPDTSTRLAEACDIIDMECGSFVLIFRKGDKDLVHADPREYGVVVNVSDEDRDELLRAVRTWAQRET